jgi:hypothetical protein
MYGYITLDMPNIGYQEFFRLERSCTFALLAAFAEKKKKRKGAGIQHDGYPTRQK